jgi:Ca2+-binding RTX toxin-like protein
MSARKALALIAAAFVSGSALTAGVGHTFAAWSDFQRVNDNTVVAGVWHPDPPASCGDLSNYDGVVYGTPGDDDINGGNHPQVIMGLGGNDTIHAGNGGDCVVGGDGDDKLYGDNAKDILVGGDGDDYLDGGNGKDDLDGGPGTADICIGGRGTDTFTDCEIEP